MDDCWLANPEPLAVSWMIPVPERLVAHVVPGPHGVPPSTTIQLNPLTLRQPLVLSQAGKLICAPGTNKIVTGLPLEPLPRALNSVLIVPQRWTVVPGPIWPTPVPQLPALLKNATAYASAQSAPVLVPAPVWAM